MTMTPPPKPRKSKIMFGPVLTPEEFDKKMPPSNPLSRGRTPPRRGSTGFSILKGIAKTKTTGTLNDVEDSPQSLCEDEGPSTPIKGDKLDLDNVPVLNLNESMMEKDEADSGKEDEATEDGPNLNMTVTSDMVNMVNMASATSPAAQPRISQGSSVTSTESDDNIVIYDTTTDGSDLESVSKSDKVAAADSTIDEFLSENVTGNAPDVDLNETDVDLNETNKSEIIQLETSQSEAEPLITPDVSVLDSSTNSEILDLEEKTSGSKERLQSEGSSCLSTESDDNIVIYSSEDSEVDSQKTEQEESVATDPGLNTTIDDFLKENITPAAAPAAQEKTPAPRRSGRKSVRFGPMLSPEEFDKKLPANTPTRKGALPGRYSVPNPQLSAGRTPLRKSVAVCGTPVGMLKLDESMESLDSMDSSKLDSVTRAKNQRRKTMTPKEIKANFAWSEVKELSSPDEKRKSHVDSPIVKQTPKGIAKAVIPLVLVRIYTYIYIFVIALSSRFHFISLMPV